MADLTIPGSCNRFGADATRQAQTVVDAAVNGKGNIGVVSNLAFQSMGKGDLGQRVANTLDCAAESSPGQARAINDAGNLFKALANNGKNTGFR